MIINTLQSSAREGLLDEAGEAKTTFKTLHTSYTRLQETLTQLRAELDDEEEQLKIFKDRVEEDISYFQKIVDGKIKGNGEDVKRRREEREDEMKMMDLRGTDLETTSRSFR